MLIDNKKKFRSQIPATMAEYLEKYIGEGEFNAVTGYFTVEFLARMYNRMNSPEQFKMIMGNLVNDESRLEDYTIDLLQGDLNVKTVLRNSADSQRAIKFLKQDKVMLKTIDKNFCHAKMYLYNDKDTRNSFYSVGSSNMTEAGMGVRESGNIELNELQQSEDNDFDKALEWFELHWEKIAKDTIRKDEKLIDFKAHVIELISQLYKKYTPEEVYHKILFELFKQDIIDFEDDTESQQNLDHLRKTKLWEILYPFQRKGALSLIKMLQRYNGAILADAVGLGKTWQALAVMKYFEMKGYQVLLLCPKKLSENWEKYRDVGDSLFKQDRLRYLVRYHTDLQYNETEEYRAQHPSEDHRTRFDSDRYKDNPLSYFQHNPKMLVVIDESHNLRNDKSSRYQFLVENILRMNEDVKVLQLSATPINNELKDIRNQFKLMVKGENDGFLDTPLAIRNLENEFRTAERAHTRWKEIEDGTLSQLVQQLPDSFTQLTDKLIVARTRKLILDYIDSDLEFPDKEKPVNVFKNPQGFGELTDFDQVLEILEKLELSAYRPADYIPQEEGKTVLEDERQRQKFLVKMMFILLIKRLESSWMSFSKTLTKILDHHTNALKKIEQFEHSGKDTEAGSNAEEMEGQDEDNEIEELTLGKKNPVKLSDIEDIELFKSHINDDILLLKALKKNIDQFEKSFSNDEIRDEKLDALREVISQKQKQANKKLVIFTTYTDTATYLFDQLKDEFDGVGLVTGSHARSNTGLSFGRFEPLLDYFAPYTKLYKERHWDELYSKEGIDGVPDYRNWKQIMKAYRPDIYQKLEEPVNILIATDCLSEGQNLQDCDCVVNYDIHWNPVRLVQRFGRIDRIGSPNDTIMGVNFWPADNYESLLDLKGRVEKRMALMILGGAEIVETSEKVEQVVKDNPLIDQQTEKMLKQLETSWDDLEDEETTFGLDDLSLEQFRQELLSVLLQNREKYDEMPNGIFSGFKIRPDLFDDPKEGMIGLLGYPKRNPNKPDHLYSELHLFYTSPNEAMVLINRQDILSFLRQHKNNERIVPSGVENGDEETLKYYSELIDIFLKAHAKKDTEDNLEDIFKGRIFDKAKAESKSEKRKEEFAEDHFIAEKFDLICWLTLTK
ncbi:MAG: helicase [Bacteroidetes bacterium]|nr:helicase [Bacteroidota bacterium]|tara:strand:+ start:34838 stop:38209 length:3372 start_codon:yes stop_codon:yes gene_type:complete